MPKVLITGANRGLGLEFVKQYCGDGWDVMACMRDLHSSTALMDLSKEYPQLTLFELDVSNPDHLIAVQRGLAQKPIDVLINNAGIYGPSGVSMDNLDVEEWSKVFNVNTIAPAIVTSTLLENVLLSDQRKVVFISSKMGSIADNSSGGSYFYRSSKCALNAVAKSLSLDLFDQSVCVLTLHPGWVQTDMGGPNALIGTAESVGGMRKVIAEADMQNSGGFFSYDGKAIPW